VRDQVAGKVEADFDDLGPHAVKNIERPVHVFVVRPQSNGADQDVERSQKISICVLPFANMSGDPEQEYFSDGISEDIITDLSKVSALSVIARNSAFAFKGKNVNIPQVARQLNANLDGVIGGSILEGTEELPVRVRIAAGERADLATIASTTLRAPGRAPPTTAASTGTAGAKAVVGVPLNALAKIEVAPKVNKITRRDGKRMSLNGNRLSILSLQGFKLA